MSKVTAFAGREPPEADPRALPSFHDDRPEVQALFEAALEARLPRKRELKTWEPQRLNEKHLAMVMMRAGGINQRTIARAFDVTDSNASIVLNHPDAEYLLSRLQAMKATQPTGIEARLAALTEPAIGTLEDVFSGFGELEEQKFALKKAPLAFKVLEFNGYAPKQKVQHDHQHSVNLDGVAPAALANLARALRESREIPEADYVVVSDPEELQKLMDGSTESPEAAAAAPEGGPWDSQTDVLSPDTDAPSISDSQEPAGFASAEGGAVLRDEEEAA